MLNNDVDTVDGVLCWVGDVDDVERSMTFWVCCNLHGINWQSPGSIPFFWFFLFVLFWFFILFDDLGKYLVPKSDLWRALRRIVYRLGIAHAQPTQQVKLIEAKAKED